LQSSVNKEKQSLEKIKQQMEEKGVRWTPGRY